VEVFAHVPEQPFQDLLNLAPGRSVDGDRMNDVTRSVSFDVQLLHDLDIRAKISFRKNCDQTMDRMTVD